MREEVINDVIAVLDEVINAIKNKKHIELHSISNHILHSIAIYQDLDLMDLAVAIYALDKIMETEKFRAHPKMPEFENFLIRNFQAAKELLIQKNFAAYESQIRTILSNIEGFSKAIKFYIEDVMHFAKIKKGTRLYEHGLSLGKATEIARVTKWDLLPSIGETTIHELLIPELPIEKRLKQIKAIFNLNTSQNGK
ncbi:MAG: hypothetical protein ACP5IJ_01420 [Candidatus Nanoarchaeia archaeon]